jgi:hypothetical protein
MKILSVFVAILCLVACDISFDSVRQYCDATVSYEIQKRDQKFRIFLRVGDVSRADACSLGRMNNRKINLEADIVSVEDGLRLVDKYKQLYEASRPKRTTPAQ